MDLIDFTESKGSQRVGTRLSDFTFTFTFNRLWRPFETHDTRLAHVSVGVYRSTWGKKNPSKTKQKALGSGDVLVGLTA